MSKWAYEMSSEELLDEFMNACGRAGTSNSGLVINFSAGNDLAQAHYLRGVLHARLDGVTPPFKLEECVSLKENARPLIYSLNTVRGRGYGHNIAPRGYIHQICRVYYEGEGKWSLYFEDDHDFRYPAEAYEKTGLKANAPRVRHEYYEPEIYASDLGSD